MAGALLSAIVERLGSLISSEFKLTVTVKEEVQKLETKFRDIQAVLNDAEKRQLKDKKVKLWVDKLQGVSDEIDNVLDEWNTGMIKAEIEKQQQEFEEEEEKAETSTAKKRKVWPLISVPNLLQHRDIAHKIKELHEKFDEIYREGKMYKFVLRDPKLTEKFVERPKTTSYADVSEILGRDKIKNDLVSTLLGKGTVKDKHPHVISLVGLGGIGKTTLAQKAYNDQEVQAYFDKRIWVCVSEPFDGCRVAKAIIEAFTGVEPKITELQSLLEKICELIGREKFFLVFDDVWTEDYAMWKPFRDALKNCGSQSSRILITTRKDQVAKMMESADTIKLNELSEEDCWLVFSKIAFFDKDPQQCEQLEDFRKQISKKCKGLPLAARTLGGLMCFKKSWEEWKNVLNSNLWELEDVERGLFAPLLLSYYDLSSPLKQCFSYCAVFPKDRVFDVDELVYMWIAHGFVESKENMEVEIIAREYFENLAMRSFFQDFKKDEDNDQIIGCKMHDIVHDFAQLISKNECFTIHSNIDLGVDYKNARHLHLKILKNAKFPESIFSAKNLRTLIFVREGGYNLSTLSQYFTRLRVLTLYCGFTLYHSRLMELLDAVGNFIHLRYLYLVNYYGDALPETICNLCNLQILHIDHGGVVGLKKLPQGMDKLINLRHFKVDNKSLGNRDIIFPKGFGRLTSLRTLNYFSVNGEDDSERCKLGELRNLDHLQGTLVINGLGKEVDQYEATNAQLKKKKNLRTLKLMFFRDSEEITRGMDAFVLNALEPPPNLEDLSIRFYKGPTMSPWMVSLTKLKKLYFEYLLIEHLPPLGKLQVLESLQIWRINRLKKLGVEFMGIEEFEKKEKDDISITLFPNLIFLQFCELSEWEEWNGIGGEEEEDCTRRFTIMPRLQHLSIRSCPKLKLLPNFLRTTPLQHLQIHGCQILEERCKRETGEEWPKISHIPNIVSYPFVGDIKNLHRRVQRDIDYRRKWQS